MPSVPGSLPTEAANTTLPAAHLNLMNSWINFLANPPSVKARVTAGGFSCADDGALHAVTFTATDDWDTDALHSTSTFTSRIIIPSGFAGKWRFEANVGWATAASSTVYWAAMRKNGTDVLAGARPTTTSSTLGMQQLVAVEAQMVATDYMELVVRQNSGGALNVLGDTVGPTWFTARWVGN